MDQRMEIKKTVVVTLSREEFEAELIKFLTENKIHGMLNMLARLQGLGYQISLEQLMDVLDNWMVYDRLRVGEIGVVKPHFPSSND